MEAAERFETPVQNEKNGKPDVEVSMMIADKQERSGNDEVLTVVRLLAHLEVSKAVVMKLLYVDTYQLTPAEIRYLADVSARSITDVLQQIDALRASVRERKATVTAHEDAVEAVQAWIQLYERHVQQISADIAGRDAADVAVAKLLEERRELEDKIQRRQRQRLRLLERIRRRKVTAPYKEIAAILNTTTGNVGSQIARLRQELSARRKATSRECASPASAPAVRARLATRAAPQPKRRVAMG